MAAHCEIGLDESVTLTDVVIVALAAGLGAFIKGVTGLGFPVIAVPLISLRLGVEHSVIAIALPNFIANFLLILQNRSAWRDTRDIPQILTFGAIGAIAGTLALVSWPEEPLVIALVAVVAYFLVQSIRAPQASISAQTSRRWSPAIGALVGILQGAIGISGPLVAGWFHRYRLTSAAFIFTVTLIFGFTGAVQIAVLGLRSEFTTDRLQLAAVMGAAMLFALPLGSRVRQRLNVERFRQLVIVVVAVSGVSLVIELITGLF